MKTTILSTWRKPGEVAIRAAWELRAAGGSLIDSLVNGLGAAELDPTLIAIGLGSVPNSEGDIELDASIMDGTTLKSGAVCAVKDICPVINVARWVMEDTIHCMLAGSEAEKFAISKGMKRQDLHTDDSRHRFKDWVENGTTIPQYVHATTDKVGDTVSMLAWEEPGHVVAASSTSGMPFKLPGRVGDSPIIGAGIYADDETGCAAATGFGEALWREVAAFRTTEGMRHGMSAQEACEATIRHLIRRQPEMLYLPSVVLAMDPQGRYGAACVAGVFELWVCQDGEMEMFEIAPIPT
jgi:N4-(beta-N-acetylglucosaminyl)-L-asparaginase